MADQPLTSRARHATLYQPTPAELANLHGRMDVTPKAGYYRRARELLADVNTNVAFNLLQGWSVRSQADANLRHPIDTRYEPPLCTCLSFQSDPTEPNSPHIFLDHPGGPHRKFLRRQCKHTIAYMGYRSILAQHCMQVQHALPKHIRLALRNGMVQPANAVALHSFACWLPLYYADQRRVTLIALETWQPWRNSNLH
jgi:hypothetical protein